MKAMVKQERWKSFAHQRETTGFNCLPFRNGNFSLMKEFAPRGSEFFPLRAVPYGMETHFYHIKCYFFITHVRNCVLGATPMENTHFLNTLLKLKSIMVTLEIIMNSSICFDTMDFGCFIVHINWS